MASILYIFCSNSCNEFPFHNRIIQIKAMDPHQLQEDSYQNIKQKSGNNIINVVPRDISPEKGVMPKKSRRKTGTRHNRLPKVMNNYRMEHESDIAQQQSRDKELERGSETKMRGADQQTAGDLNEGGLAVPYEFLTQRSPSLFRIFFPRFTIKSVTFVLSILYVVMFVILIIYNYSKEQTEITWNCSLYRLQNKYFPRLNRKYEVWRVLTSALFHSNIAHFFLNLFALQIYGYFVEWYYQTKQYVVTIVVAMIYSHFFAAVVQTTSVSTTSSAITMAIIALKIYFLWEYRHYRKLMDRRTFLYVLMGLIVGINLIPLFVVNNVDYSAHLGGFIAGGLLGLFYHLRKIEEPTKCDRVLMGLSLTLLILSFLLVVALTFSLSNPDYEYLASNIETMCLNNHT